MIRFKITVRMTDNTTEITIEARQPMRETRMLDTFREWQRAGPRRTRHRRFMRATDHQAWGPCSSRRSVEGRNSGIVAATAAGLRQAAANHVASGRSVGSRSSAVIGVVRLKVISSPRANRVRGRT
jgi:hypothetical protein